MWAVDLGPCAIHMDDKPHSFAPPPPPTPSSSPSNDHSDNDQQADTRPTKRRQVVVDASTTCAPEQLHCRYANKKCLNPRAVKRTGGLHTFCAMHRANANRNQRRLDQRKRQARQAQRALQQGQQPAALTTNEEVALKEDDDRDALYEPLTTPTPLQEEDISTLVTLFLPPSPQDITFGSQSRAPALSPRSHYWPPSSTNGAPPPPPSGGMTF